MLSALDLRAWALVALLAVVLGTAAFVGGCVHGEGLAAGRAAKLTVKTQQADAARVERVTDAAQSVASESAEVQVRIETRYKTIEREVIRYVQTTAAAELCLDDDGLRLWRAANRGEFDATEPQPAGRTALSGAGSAGERLAGRSADESRSAGESVPGVSAPAGSAGAAHQGGAASATAEMTKVPR